MVTTEHPTVWIHAEHGLFGGVAHDQRSPELTAQISHAYGFIKKEFAPLVRDKFVSKNATSNSQACCFLKLTVPKRPKSLQWPMREKRGE